MQFLAATLSACIAIAAFGINIIVTDDKFVPIFYDKAEQLRIDGQPTEVFRYFEPKWRKFMYDWWDLKPVYVPADGSLLGASFRVLPPGHDKKEAVFVNVTHFNCKALEIHYTILWGDYELQKIEVVCRKNKNGGTTAEVRTMTMGLSPEGNKAVTHYSKGGGEEAGNARYAKGLNKYIKTLKEGP